MIEGVEGLPGVFGVPVGVGKSRKIAKAETVGLTYHLPGIGAFEVNPDFITEVEVDGIEHIRPTHRFERVVIALTGIDRAGSGSPLPGPPDT